MSRDSLDPTSESAESPRVDGSSRPRTDAAGADPLLADLRALRDHAVAGSSHAERRIHREARAAFVEAFDDTPPFARLLRGLGRAAVPLVLASVVGIYLMWAINTAAALVQ